MNKNNTILSMFTIVAVISLGIAAYTYQNAAALSTTMNCAPNCFDEVSDHLRAADNKMDEADLQGAKAELAIVKALINQLEQTTSIPSTEEAE